MGFASGVQAAFEQQSREKQQEWGLVMVKPIEVVKAAEALQKAIPREAPECDGNQMSQWAKGYLDGKQHVSQKRIQEGA